MTPKTIGYKYTYDQLNRLNDLVAFTAIDTVNDKWNSPSSISSFQERITYDENGNIFKYVRHGNTIAGMPLAMDSLNYYYNKGTNQLNHVTDGVSAGNYTNDIDNETSSRNYRYNAIGQLAKDSAGGLDTIIWTAYNKIKKVVKYNNDSLVYEYDASGNRNEKRYYPNGGTADTTLYIRDAQGDVLATYDRHKDTVRLTEWDMYGSKRIGSVDTLMRVFPKYPSIIGGSIDSSTITYLENQKQYELDNHLGNVMVTVSDKKIPIDTNSDGKADYYLPNIVSANDLYPFGMVQPGRSYQIAKDSSYHYGFNGDMKDNEIYGFDNAHTTKFRELDNRLGGRWWSVDPKTKAPESPYAGFADNPIWFVDPNGDDNYTLDRKGNITLTKKTNDKNDKLFATDKNGHVKDKFMPVAKGILNSKTTRTDEVINAYGDGDNKPPGSPKQETWSSDQYNIKIPSKGLFEFVSKNSDVEWSYTILGDQSGGNKERILITSHHAHQTVGASDLLRDGFNDALTVHNVQVDIHSHPSPGAGFPSPSDAATHGDLLKTYPDLKSEIFYVPDNVYIPYDKTNIYFPKDYVPKQ